MGKLAELNESLAAIRGDNLPQLPNEVATAIEGLCERMETALAPQAGVDLTGMERAISELAKAMRNIQPPVVEVNPVIDYPKIEIPRIEPPVIDIPSAQVEVIRNNDPIQFDIIRDSDGYMIQVVARPHEPVEVVVQEFDVE